MNNFDTSNPLSWVFVGTAALQAFRISRLRWMFDGFTKHELPPALVAVLAIGGLGALAGQCPGHPWLWLVAAASIWALQRVIALFPGPMLSSGEHYRAELFSNVGKTRVLYLVQLEASETGLALAYQCPSRLSVKEADLVDSRLRAYIACCLCDAAKRVGLDVAAGPPHGRRPSWMLADLNIPVGLQNASFDKDGNIWLFSLSIGPILLGRAELSKQSANALAKAFLKHYRIVRV